MTGLSAGSGPAPAVRELVTEHILQVHLEVSVGADAAALLQARAGFPTWGEEPRSMQVDGAFIGQRHMLSMLDGEPGA